MSFRLGFSLQKGDKYVPFFKGKLEWQSHKRKGFNPYINILL